ncbi:hypothetical protein B0T19DRAFT_420827 [Cercophora scortea]|uniref:YCII-related domain-containing protein n=1 Tax=Cercophora scortea TaxID=314031 RepID=A0AAE0IL41_9PEZI|nr:hypothetical protein B0T19DRAFT_420827 [Cercophora scortea]
MASSCSSFSRLRSLITISIPRTPVILHPRSNPAASAFVTYTRSAAAARRNMSSSAAPVRKYEWLVVIPDFPGALAKRIEARPLHFAGLKPAMESGLYKMGGAVLDEVPADDEPTSLKMSGSTVIIVAESKEEILKVLRDDIYAKSGVWDVDNVSFICAPLPSQVTPIRKKQTNLTLGTSNKKTGADVAPEVRLQDSRGTVKKRGRQNHNFLSDIKISSSRETPENTQIHAKDPYQTRTPSSSTKRDTKLGCRFLP